MSSVIVSSSQFSWFSFVPPRPVPELRCRRGLGVQIQTTTAKTKSVSTLGTDGPIRFPRSCSLSLGRLQKPRRSRDFLLGCAR